jgi:steroid delta-isomerase-like uncharacterized protein
LHNRPSGFRGLSLARANEVKRSRSTTWRRDDWTTLAGACIGVQKFPAYEGRPVSRATTESLIARYYDAFNRGDAEGMLSCLAEDVAHDVNQGVRRPGKAAFRTFLEHMNRCYREKLEDIIIMASADGGRAAAEFNVRGVYLATDEGLPPASGQTYVLPAGTFFVVRDGLIARVTTYYNLTDWLMQVSGEGEL